jgi:RNA polymerase sigma-70 factor (ECF subfamily)
VGWVYRVVRNRAINASRSSGRQARREAAVARRGESWFEKAAADRLDAAAATDALRALPAEQREVIVARLWGGLSLDEVSRLTGLSTSTAYRRYQQGLSTLRERLGVECPAKKKDVTS